MYTIKYDPRAGKHVADAAAFAIAMLKPSAKGQRACVRFNDVTLLIGISDTPARIEKLYLDILRARSERWRNSPEGQTYFATEATEDARAQASVTAHLKSLVGLVNLKESDLQVSKLSILMGWLATFTEDAQGKKIDWNAAAGVRGGGKEWAAFLFESAGFRQDDCLGLSDEAYRNPDTLGRYIIGQVIACLRRGLPPHPITSDFCQKYFALKANPVKEGNG